MEETLTTSVFDELETEQIEYATQGQRFVNFLIDFVAYYIFNILFQGVVDLAIALATRSAETVQRFARNPLCTLVVAIVAQFIFYTFIEGITRGRTLGKLITRTQAVRHEDLSPITWKDALIRSLCRMVPFEPFSALGNEPWHDKWSKTTVIKKRQRFV